MQPTYIQMRISSTEVLSRELIAILSARTLNELKDAIANNQEYWVSVFHDLMKLDFSHLYHLRSYSHTSNYSYVTLDVAIRYMGNFANGSIAYGDAKNQEKKFRQLLNALSFIDCDIYVTLLTKRFKWSLVEELLGVNRGTESEEPEEGSEVYGLPD